MIDVPVALVLIGSALQAVGPISRIAGGLRPRINAMSAGDRRIAAADEALARDPLILGIVGITEIYSAG